MTKFILSFFGFLLCTLVAWTQIPTITNFSPASGPIGTVVTINGTNFSTTLANNVVYFGSVRATTINSATSAQLVVVVPAGAMHQPISVTVGGLKGASATPFIVAFDGSGINSSSFEPRVNFTTGTDPAYVALGDLDGDGKIDVVTPNNGSITTASVFRNLSAGPGSISFTAKSDITVGSNPISAKIGDIDGDGLPDLVVANSNGSSYSIFRNTSTFGNISFASKVDITGTTAIPYDMALGDIDGDGKVDLAVVNNGGTTLSIYRNTSTVGSISFAPKVDYTPAEPPVSVALGDLDGDGKLDVAVACFLGTTSNAISLFRNTSTPGTISLASKVDIVPGSQPRDVKIGDLDGDGKADLAVANGASGTMSVFRNTSTVGNLSFATRIDHTAGTGTISVSMGDIDGDAKVDLAVANFTDGTVSVFKNNSTSGTINFSTKVNFPTDTQPRCVFIADQDGDGKQDLATANFGSDTFSVLRNICKVNQTITFGALPGKTFGNAPFSVSATASSGLTPVFSSDNAAAASVSGNSVTITGAGTCNIIATQPGDATYNAATAMQTLVVSKANQTVTFGALPTKSVGDAPFALGASASSLLAVTYASSNSTVATVSGNTVTIVGAGSATITASQAGNTNFNAATDVQQTLLVSKGNQVITFGSLSARNFGDAAFNLTATASSGLPITYSSSNTAVATVSGSTVTIVGVGSTTITASQAGNANYNAAANVPQTFTVSKGNQTITFGALTAKNFGDAAFDLLGTVSSGLSINYVSSNTAVATISGSTVTIVGVGSSTITASQSGNANYNAATNVQQTLTVNKAAQTITFGTLPTKTFGDPDFNLSATTTSGLAIAYASSNASVATISGNVVSIIGVGSTTITASQAGNTNYNAATAAQQILTVAKADQTITFGALAAKTYGDPTFALTATSSSALPVVFSSSNVSVATVSGNTVTIVGGGTTTITASQPGNGSYNAAINVQQLLTVNKATQTVTFGILADKTFGDPDFTLSATSSSGLPVSYASDNASVATISGNTITIVGGGIATITALQAGNANYNAASLDRTLNVNPASQSISFAALSSYQVGDSFELAATASSNLPLTYTSSDPSVAAISGNTVTVLAVGSTTISAAQIGNANYTAAQSVDQVLTVVKGNQTITFAPLADKVFGDSDFALTATTSSGLPVSFSSSNTEVVTIAGNTATIVGAGSAVITASQAGDSNFNAAADVTRSIDVAKSTQSILFNTLSDKNEGDASFPLSATASSGLDVSFSTVSNKISITGNQVTVISGGRATIVAAQPGNVNYLAADAVERSFCIKPATPVITVSNNNSESPLLTSNATAGNQWFLNGVAITGATASTLSATQPGVYRVKSTIDDCESATSADMPIIITGDLDNDNTSIVIYPNPASDLLTISLQGIAGKKKVMISHLNGVQREMQDVNGNEAQFHVADYASGIYVVTVKSERAVNVFRFVKK